MDSSRYVGRVGGLAVALGVGAAVLSSLAVASAETGSQDSAGASSSSARGPAAGRSPHPSLRNPAAQAPETRSQSAVTPRAAASRPGTTTASKAAQSGLGDGTASPSAAEPTGGGPQRPARTGAARAAAASATTVSGVDVPAGVSVDPAPVGASTAAAAATVSTRPLPTPASPAAATPSALSSVPDPDALVAKVSPRAVVITAVSTAATFAFSMLGQFAIALHLGPSRSALNQTVNLNGISFVPSSTELVTSFYGPWTYGPGGLNIIQGQQRYTVVDPAGQQPLGTFDALVSSGKTLGQFDYSELLVTAASGSIGADKVPPVGSVIASMKLFAGFGWTYSAIPSPSGDLVSFAVTTPFGNIPLPFKFDAAQGIADHTVDNRPIDLGNGYAIAPSDPASEIYTGTSGLLPLFQGVQTSQRFDVRDSAGNTVGSFDGVATTTWDAIGAYTEAVLVTHSYGDNVGTNPGQVPPPGTVYNVAYNGADTDYDLYTSKPSPSGDIISMIESTNGAVTNIATFPVNLLNASSPPVVRRLPFTGGYGILPTSDLTPSGANGLPPRDVQIQGYQQFGVYDPSGVARGSFDAIVTRQWDLMGVSSTAIIVTKVTDGTAGTANGDVPPVGSVLNYVYFGDGQFGTAYWSLPSPSGTKISYKVLTPIIGIPTWSTYDASAGLGSVTFA